MPEHPLPIATDVFKVTLVWRDSTVPREATTSMYFLDIPGTQTEANLNTDFGASVTAGMWTTVLTGASIEAMKIIRLDGVSGTQIFNLAANAKWDGAGGTDPILQGAHVISFQTGLRGKENRSRIYLPWVAELQQTAGVLNSTNVATMQTAWNTFMGAMVTAGWQLSTVAYAVPPAVSPSNAVTTITVRPYLNTQRRRARR